MSDVIINMIYLTGGGGGNAVRIMKDERMHQHVSIMNCYFDTMLLKNTRYY